jgi:UDP-N-acetylglucosamine 4,6-dehydratase
LRTFDFSSAAVLITGGTGSFGSAFARRLLADNPPARLVVFSRDEHKQETLARTFRQEFPDRFNRLRFFIGDVRDKDRLELAMRDVDYVVHAAALKIIPTAEYNPFECIMTNVHGTENVVKASLRCGVQKVVALSTDKAANPINLYGASKLAADKIIVAANNLSGETGPAFSVVRYGNVIGSRGSVVELFQRLVRDGARSLPITDPRMTRFWISLDQGVAFVISCFSMLCGGEIFVPKIPSMRITDLARTIAPAMLHDIVGIRAGEKLHEVMITEDDARVTVELDDCYIILPSNRNRDATNVIPRDARPVVEGFRYSSDTNTEWLDNQTLLDLLSRKAA